MTQAFRISVLFCVLAFAAFGRLPGQATSARIFGSVQNQEGKFLAGVEVTATNVANNSETKVYTSGAKGTFSFLGLSPGGYQVSCDLKGYYSYVAAGIRLSADQSTTLRITLKRQPGAEGAVDGQPEPGLPVDVGPLKTWQVELSAGAFDRQPDELNNFVYSDLKVSRDLPNNYFWQYRDQGYNLIISSYNGHPVGMLQPLGGIQPLTVRLRFSLNRWFSLAAGIGWSERRKASAFSLTHDFLNPNAASNPFPERFSVISEFPDYQLRVKTLFPHVGAQASLTMSRSLRLAGFVHAGWIFAECRHSSLKIVHDGLLGKVTTQTLAMEGRGNCPALEAGLKGEFAVWRGLGAFIELAYLMSRVTHVTGESVAAETVQDQKTLATLSSSMEKRVGQWGKSSEFFARPEIWPDGGPKPDPPFALELGGPGLRLGLLFRF